MSSDNSWFYVQQSRYKSVAGPHSSQKISPEALIGLGLAVIIILFIFKKNFSKIMLFIYTKKSDHPPTDDDSNKN